jgi:hypothetical protein
MKTTVEIPEKTLKRARALAATKGLSLEQLVAEAIEDKIGRGEELVKGEPRWKNSMELSLNRRTCVPTRGASKK